MTNQKDEYARAAGVRDVERGELESEGNLVALHKERRRDDGETPSNGKVTPAKTEKGWYAKSGSAQRRALERLMGTYRPHATDPIRLPTSRNGVRSPGTLKDHHESQKVRRRDNEAGALIRAAAPAPQPAVIQLPPLPAIVGYCHYHYCGAPIPPEMRADSKFCCGAHRTAFSRHEANRQKLDKLFKDHKQSQHAGRMLDVYRFAAGAMQDSADRLGIDATFTATDDGVVAVHAAPLPPIAWRVTPDFTGIATPNLSTPWQARVRSELGDGSTGCEANVVATATDTGTLFAFEMAAPPQGPVMNVWIEFEGDPGFHIDEPTVQPVPPVLSGRQAILTNRVVEYLATRRNALVTANSG
jgi:hypothetical protein